MKNKKHNENLRDVASVYVINDYADGFEHEYDIVRDNENDETIIKRSNSSSWTEDCRGEVIGSLFDSGNDIYIKIYGTGFRLDYSQIEVLTALIMACNSTDMEVREHKVISKLTNQNK